MQNGPIYPAVAQPYAVSPQVDGGMAHAQPGNGMHIQMLPIEPPNELSHGGAASIPVAVPNKTVEDEMQAKPGIFTNQRGNLKFVASVARCPCCSLCIVYGICIAIIMILASSLASAAKDDGFSAIITSMAQYQPSDDRSIKMDSLQLAHDDIGTDISLWTLHDEDKDDCWSSAEFDKMCVPPCDLKFVDVIKAVDNDGKCGSNKISRSDYDNKLEDITTYKQPIVRPMTQMMGIFYVLYAAKKKADFTIFNTEVAKKIREVEDLAVKDKDFDKWCVRMDDKDYKCNTYPSPLRFLYASEFDVDKASKVIKQLKSEDKDANGMTIIDAHKRMGPCYDFGIPAMAAIAVCDSGCLPPTFKCAVSPESKAKSQTLSAELKSITDKWDGQAKQPLGDTQMSVLAELVAYMKLLPSQAMKIDFYVDSAFNSTNIKSKHSRSIIPFGGPIDGMVDGQRQYRNTGHKRKEQGDKLKAYIISNLNKKFLEASSSSFSDVVQVYYFMTALIFDVFIQILLQDAMLAIFSISSVFVYIWIVTGSVFLAIVGMSEILLSLPASWFIMRVILQVKYFPGLNMLAIFIVCAIGADDIFVFMDAYVQSAYMGPSVCRDMETRFSWVYRKSGLAMFLTSFTTCLSFLCCFTSPLVDTMCFGLFALFVIAFDYVLVMTMYCTAVMVYHNRFEKPPLCGSKCCGCCTQNCDCTITKPSPTEKALTASQAGGPGLEADAVSHFFRTKFASMILNWKARCVIAVVAIAWIIPAIIYTSRLQPTTKPEQFLNENHPFQKAITTLNEFGSNSDNPGIDVYYIWGLRDLDRTGVNFLMDSKYIGKVRYNENFKFSAACQDKIWEVCQDLKIRNNTQEYLDIIQRNKVAQGSIKCFVLDLKDENNFLKKNKAIDHEDPPSWLPAFMETKRKENEDEEISRELTMKEIYNSGGSSRIGFNKNSKELKFVAISVESKQITQWDRPSEEFMMSQYKEYQKLRERIAWRIGDSCGTGVETFMTDRYDGMGAGDSKFVFMNTQKVYSSSSLSGALAGVGIAFGVLLGCTWDLKDPLDGIMLSTFATVSIFGTLMSVLGLLVMVGWSLGSIEAILITILAGFSVDYVTHLAHAYAHNYGTNEERIIATFGEMGGPVVHGMATSVIASIPLLLCNLQYFIKFGAFFLLTIIFSWLWSNFVFMGVMATIGRPKFKVGSAPGAVHPSSAQEAGRDLPADK